MIHNLNKLEQTLFSLGQEDASQEVSALLRELGNEITSRAALSDFLGQPTSALNGPSTGEAAKWQKILDDYNKPAYRVEEFHRIAEGIARSITGPIRNNTERVISEEELEAPTERDREDTISDLSSIANIDQAKGLLKIASQEAYMELFKKEACANLDIIANELSEKYKDEAHYIREEIRFAKTALLGGVGRSILNAGRSVGRGAIRALPVVGLLISLPLAIKNTIEAYHNGVAIFSELPLEKYGISKLAVALGPAGGIFVVTNQIQTAISNNIDDPDALYELLTIIKTLAAFALDVLFAITNSIMAIIDAITVLAIMFPLDGPVFDAITGFIGVFISIALMGLEWYSMKKSEKFWEKIKVRIKNRAEAQLSQMSRLPTENQTTSDAVEVRGPTETILSQITNSPTELSLAG